MKEINKITAALLVAGLAVSNIAQAEILYNIMDLGTLQGFDSSYGYRINASGQVTGTSYAVNGDQRAFVTSSSGIMSDLGTLGGNQSNGKDINDSGQVVGMSTTADGNFHGFITNSANIMTQYNGIAVGINNSGQTTAISPGYLPLGGPATGMAINDIGQMTGLAVSIQGGSHAFVSSASGIITDLGVLSGFNNIEYDAQGQAIHFVSTSRGYDINDSGQVAGESTTLDNSQHAFVTSISGQMLDLGVLAGGVKSGADGINNLGQVVGYSTMADGSYHGFVTENGIMKDLNTAMVASVTGWMINAAYGINDSGQITGDGTFNGLSRAFVLTPVSSVPVPAAIWFFTSGLGLLAFNSRRKAQC